MWRNARLEWLEKNGADDAFMLRERSRLSVFRNFDADHLTPLFMYMAAKSFVDKPVLCAVLMRMWSMQEGLHITGDGYAETLFFSACVWASGLSFGA
ncbi:MAG: hypothetical protein EOO65_01180 [Methanosarcinales archaeon]|nr:MAG: hypothetical protein EOO65_01180 [Methanosarcinales archaeon]